MFLCAFDPSSHTQLRGCVKSDPFIQLALKVYKCTLISALCKGLDRCIYFVLLVERTSFRLNFEFTWLLPLIIVLSHAEPGQLCSSHFFVGVISFNLHYACGKWKTHLHITVEDLGDKNKATYTNFSTVSVTHLSAHSNQWDCLKPPEIISLSLAFFLLWKLCVYLQTS